MPDHIPNQSVEEDRFAELLASLDADAPPVDYELLAALRDKSADAFAERTSLRPTPTPGRSPMSTVLTTLTAVSAAAAAILWAAVFDPNSSENAPPFGEVLVRTAQAETLHLELRRDDSVEQLWVKPALKTARWTRADQEYSIIRGETQWNVRTAENQAESSATNLFPAALPGLDLFSLLMIPEDVPREQFLKSAPVEQTKRDGKIVNLYRWHAPTDGAEYVIEAWVDAQRQRLLSLQSATERRGGPRAPLAELSVVSVNRPVDEDLFVVGKHLTEDGRIGKVIDVQGNVTLRPVMHHRWTPTAPQMLLRVGDWVRTDVRGANAATLRLSPGASLTLGPGSLVELSSPTKLRLVTGEAKLVTVEGSPVEVSGPGDSTQSITTESLLSVSDGKLTRLERTPRWLAGFEGATNDHSLGSLVAKVDGRDTPLSVGYHHVRVDIRDQIARTVIEESFVNHTGGRLEGVFYFPLPPDASISGFGMWIGGELIEADIVEKQRAREIYETILRERRDPGLLEWTGGNLFKARVFPIEGHSEKRIKISYTQVLPQRGGKYRYSYPLQSDLLKQNPLRELAIDLRLHSSAGVAAIDSPTHPGARIQRTASSAHVEFAAQEHTPESDFEVVVTAAAEQPSVVMVPHRRGEDGYFMLMLQPPGSPGQWRREVVADGAPLDLLVLADTSGSMDPASREAQAEFVAALLSSLGPEDKFNLAVCDVDCQWVFADGQAANETSITAARDKLAGRTSLGWTDLDKAFASALQRAGKNTQVVYVGDGITTTGDADPAAFARRLKQLTKDAHCAMHAVATSSSFEPLALKAIASQGGSVRRLTGERTPQSTAAELLQEITQPSLRNLRVEFDGIQTARVYPGELPNLPVGAQQIVLGRYLPQGKDQRGEVVVTGTLDGQPVRYHTEVTLNNTPEAADSPEDSSFIPRLWARSHLDALLEQGASQAVQDEIITLSEEHHLMTPYTSLLVLETDEDRERFKVKRRFQMRDAQRFFAEGRDNANFELLSDQMRGAGAWRVGLRRQVLAELMNLGRSTAALQPARPEVRWATSSRSSGMANDKWFFSQPSDGGFGGGLDGRAVRWGEFSGPMSGPLDGFVPVTSTVTTDFSWLASDELSVVGDGIERWADSQAREISLESWDVELGQRFNAPQSLGFVELYDRSKALTISSDSAVSDLYAGATITGVERLGRQGSLGLAGVFGRRAANEEYFSHAGYPVRGYSWLDTLFPPLPAGPGLSDQRAAREPWPEDARRLADALLRTDALATLTGGLKIDRQVQSFDPHWATLTSKRSTVELVSPVRWLTRTQSAGEQTLVSWCDKEHRGVLSLAFELGRRRKATEGDLTHPPLGLPAHTLSPVAQSHAEYTARVEPAEDGQQTLVLTPRNNPAYSLRYLIDTQRHVVLAVESLQAGKITSTTRYDQFAEVAGAWWPGRTRVFDSQARRTSETSDRFTVLEQKAFDAEVEDHLSALTKVQLISDPLPTHPDALRAVDAGSASFSDFITLLATHSQRNQWEPAIEHLTTAEKLAGDRTGMQWVRKALLQMSRQHEQLRDQIMADAARVAQHPSPEDLFLANHLLGQASGVLGANETLALLDALQPVFQRQPLHTKAVKTWLRSRVSQLQNLGRADEALAIQQGLANDYPHDVQAQLDYARALFNAEDRDRAFAWLDRVTSEEANWPANEEQQLREAYVDLLESLGRWSDAADYLARWAARNPETDRPYERRLTSLLRLDKLQEMNELIQSWLNAGREDGALTPATLARLKAAVSQALGRGYAIRTNRLDEQWLAPLADTVRSFARHKEHAFIAEQIMSDGNFHDTDECRRLRSEFLKTLQANAATLPPEELNRYINWVLANDPAVENDQWAPIAEVIQQRWKAEQDDQLQQQLAQALERILSSRFVDKHLEFLRTKLAAASDEERSTIANTLFNQLLARPWSVEREDELIALLTELAAPAAAPDQRLAAEVQALHRLTDRMVEARYDAAMDKVQHQEALTRTELSDKQSDALRLAREEFATRLQAAAAERPERLRPWLQIERLYLHTQVGSELDRVAQECWQYVESHPPGAEDPTGAKSTASEQLEATLLTRHLLTLANLATRSSARPELAERLLKWVDQNIAQSPTTEANWRYFKYQLLIALDRPAELADSLRQWLRADDPLHLWRVSLAYLLAEQGKLEEAVGLLEAVRDSGELGPSDFRTLADWRLTLGQRQEYERAMVEVYAATPEWQLQNWLWQQLRPWQNASQQTPSDLSQEVLHAFAALLRKSSTPQNHTSVLQQYYRTTRDFRLLACLADSVTGHTAERVYPLLGSLGPVLQEILEEATVDALVDEIQSARERAESPLDQRALDLLEVVVERRASMLQNQPGPHAERALASLKRAFDREWAPGEQSRMADFLAGLGTVREDAFAEEQTRELQTLHAGAEPGSQTRLNIAAALARCQWGYGDQQRAIDQLEAALAEYRSAHDGALPADAHSALDAYLSYLESRGLFARGEQVLLAELDQPHLDPQRQWLRLRLYRLYRGAIANGGAVSLGEGGELFSAVQRELQQQLDTTDHNHRHAVVDELCNLYTTASDKKVPGYEEDLKNFAYKRMPEVLRRQTNNYQNMVQRVADTLRSILGPGEGLRFLITCLENEPDWFRYTYQDGWRQFGWQVANWRKEAQEAGQFRGDLEPRLIKIVLQELRTDLETRAHTNRYLYHRDYSGSYYWEPKEALFEHVAEEVYRERKRSGAAVKYIADYLYRGTRRYRRAIEMLSAANTSGLLDEDGQATLVRYLHEQNRYGESIALLEDLMKLRPDNLEYRTRLMHAYFRTDRGEELTALLNATDEYFHQSNRWGAGPLAELAKSCLDNRRFEQSVAYYEELIPLHQRTQPNRGIGDGTLSGYYANLARAYAGLNNTAKAVDAASGAIVSWGPNEANRRYAIDALRDILTAAPDLDAYVAQLDAEGEATGLDNPLVRKQLGRVYSEKGQYDKAIEQLKLARDAQPNDADLHRLLVECYDKSKDPQGAVAALLDAIELSPRDIALYQDLARRYREAAELEQAERAVTSIVEALPTESESHASLAEVRQQQDRWDEAINHWRRVSELRRLEPTGLLKLAEAQLHQQQWPAARETIKKLRSRQWPSRFPNVEHQVRELERRWERK